MTEVSNPPVARRWDWRSFWFAVSVIVGMSLAVYSRGPVVVVYRDAAGKRVHEDVISFGMPKAWVTYEPADPTRERPAFRWSNLRLRIAGVGIYVPSLVMGILFISLLAAAVVAWQPWIRHSITIQSLALAAAVGLVAGSIARLNTVPGGEPLTWVHYALFVGWPIVLVAISLRKSGLVQVALICLASVLAFWWSLRMLDFLMETHFVHGLDMREDLLAPLVLWIVLALVVLLGLGFLRVCRSLRARFRST